MAAGDSRGKHIIGYQAIRLAGIPGPGAENRRSAILSVVFPGSDPGQYPGRYDGPGMTPATDIVLL